MILKLIKHYYKINFFLKMFHQSKMKVILFKMKDFVTFHILNFRPNNQLKIEIFKLNINMTTIYIKKLNKAKDIKSKNKYNKIS